MEVIYPFRHPPVMNAKTLIIASTFIAVVAVMAVSMYTIPDKVTDDRLVYEYSDGKAVLVSTEGWSGDVLVIPSHIDHHGLQVPVVGLADECLYFVDANTVSIPETVERIGNDPFPGDMFEVILHPDNRHFTLVDGSLYSKDMTRLVSACPELGSEEFTIPDTVVTVDRGAFKYRVDLKTLNIGASVENIDVTFKNLAALETLTVAEGNEHFTVVDGVLFTSDMEKLIFRPGPAPGDSYVVPDGVKEIADNAFIHSIHLKSITLPDTLESIGEYAFAYSNSLTSLTIPDSVKTIGEFVIDDGMALEYVYIGASVEEIPFGMFYGCSFITEVTVSPDNAAYRNEGPAVVSADGTNFVYFPADLDMDSYSVPEGVTHIEPYAFRECRLVSVTLPDSIEDIGFSAFEECGLLESVEFGTGLTLITDYIFYGCFSLVSVNIPETVTKIDNKAFAKCMSMTSIVLPEGIEVIGDDVFMNTQISELRLPSTLVEIGTISDNSALASIVVAEGGGFKSVDGVLFTADGRELVKYPSSKADRTYVVPEGVEKIREYAFDHSRNLESVLLPSTLKGIENHAFEKCTSLKSVVIPDQVVSIGWLAFFDCHALETVVFGKSLERIDDYAFLMCVSLKELTFRGDSVPKIGEEVFQAGTDVLPVVIVVNSNLPSGFLDGTGWDYTEFDYRAL